jgi:ketosteroid isomerase-like protein
MAENLEIVRRALRRYSDQDVDGMLEAIHPEIEIDYSESMRRMRPFIAGTRDVLPSYAAATRISKSGASKRWS